VVVTLDRPWGKSRSKSVWVQNREERVTSRLKQYWRPLADLFPLTGIGLILTAFSVCGWLVWVDGSHDFVVRSSIIAIVTVMCVCILTTVIGTLFIRQSVRFETQALAGQWETNQSHKTGFRARRLPYWPLIQIDVSWSDLSQAQPRLVKDGRYWQEHAQTVGRGRMTQIVRRITVKDIFGFSAMTLKHRQVASIVISPSKAILSLVPELRQAEGDGSSHPLGEPVGDYIEMRRYAPGDPQRFILWKAFARSRKLLVRTPERAIAPRPNAAAFFVSGPNDEETASLARTVLEQGLLGEDLIFGATGTVGPIRQRAKALDAIVESAHHRHRDGRDLAQFLATIDPARRNHCVLFLPSQDGAWRDHVTAAIVQLPRPPLVLIAVDGPAVQAQSSKRTRLFDDVVATERLRRLPSLYDHVANTGSRVQIIHKSEQRIMTGTDLTALRSI